MAKKKGNQPRKGRGRKQRQGAPRAPPANANALVHAVCGLTDPFCQHAFGARRPDNTAGRTVAYSHIHQTTLTSDANGKICFGMHPGWPGGWFGAGSIVGDTVTSTAAITAWNDTAGINTTGTKWRITSWGFKVSTIASPMNNSGMIYIRQFANTSQLASFVGTSTLSQQYINVPARACDSYGVVGQPLGSNATLFNDNDTTLTIAGSQDYGWYNYVVYGSGLPASTSCVVIEVILHFEFLFPDGSGYSYFATPAPKANSLLTDMAGRVQQETSAFVGRRVEAMSTYLLNAAKGVVYSAVRGAVNSRTGGYGGRIMDLAMAQEVD